MAAPASIRALVLMPMLPGYEAVMEVVAATVTDLQLELVRLEELLEDWEWLEWLYAAVHRCDLVVADPSEHNAFVMYELGVARVSARPTLVMLDRGDSQLSGSLDGVPFLLYSSDELDVFSRRLRTDISLLAGAAGNGAGDAPGPREYYRQAVRLLEGFRDETGRSIDVVDEGAFTARLRHSMSHGTFVPSIADTSLGRAGLLAALVRSSRMTNTMAEIREWVALRGHD